MKIIIPLQRSGSTWVYKYMHQHNMLYHNAEKISPSEFLGPGFHKRIHSLKTVDNDQKAYWEEFRNRHDIDFSSIDEKIDFLIDKKRCGKNYSLKVIPSQIKLHTELFNNFIKDYDIITLVRKNMWQCCLSRLIQEVTNWQYTHDRNDGTRKNLFEQIKNKIVLKNFENKISETFDNLTFINKLTNANKLYYEDLSDDFLYEFFNIPRNQNIHNFNKLNIDYESCIENIDEIREEYKKYVWCV